MLVPHDSEKTEINYFNPFKQTKGNSLKIFSNFFKTCTYYR